MRGFGHEGDHALLGAGPFRVDRDVDALVAEWQGLTEPLRAWMAEPYLEAFATLGSLPDRDLSE